jgi:fructuronate reductase
VRLGAAAIASLPVQVRRPSYDRESMGIGIVHIGIGAFHRAHQALYTDDAMNSGQRDWGILGVSLRSSEVARQLNPQDGWYTVATRTSVAAEYRLVGAVRAVAVAAEEPVCVERAISADTTHVVTLTITEKGYCRGADGNLDRTHAGADSVYALLARGLARRRDAGRSGLTLLSCDNLSHNGAQLRQLLGQYLEDRDASLATWVDRQCTFPSSMVDRIVPATTDADRDAAESALGVRDEAHVGTEPFSQWVIEDRFAGARPAWEAQGAQLVRDVAPFETAKLRMLNGAHSALAYLGIQRCHTFVHEAIADPPIRILVEKLMCEEAAPTISAAPGQDLRNYAVALIARFSNSALNHRLSQIAMDGSQKIPQRWLATLAWQQRAGNSCPAILAALAAWLWHVRGDGHFVDDPKAAELLATWQRCGASQIVPALFGAGGLLASDWTPTTEDRAHIERAIVDNPAVGT